MGGTSWHIDPSRFRLLDDELRLDPEIERGIRMLEQGLITPSFRILFTRPNWQQLRQEQLNRMLAQPTRPSQRPNPPGNRPAPTLRAAELSDLLQAIWATSQVQQVVNQTLEQVRQSATRQWRGASAGGRAAMIGSVGFVAATAMTGILANRPTRAAALDLLDDRLISVPRVPGLAVQLRGRGRGAGSRLSNIGGTGISVGGGAAANASGGVDWDVNIAIDLTQLVPQLR